MATSTEVFANVIYSYLEERAKNDSVLAFKYEAKQKDIEGCCKYILAEVKKSGRQFYEKEEIFGMAIHYFDEDIKAPSETDANVRIVVNAELLSKEDRARLDAEARKEAEEQYLESARKKILDERAKADKKKAERKAKAAEEKKKEDALFAGTLFDFNND